MRKLERWLAGTAAAAIAVGGIGLAPAAAQSGRVSPHPAKGTPELAASGHVEQVRQLVQCGGTMFAVGTFTKIRRGGTTYTRNNIFSFKATFPFSVNSWAPAANGTVNSIALTRDCAHAYIGGSFTQVDGQPAASIAEIQTRSNALVAGFGHNANGPVNTVLLTPNGHLLAGGGFTTINGSSAHHYYASLSPATGNDDGYLNLNISGHYVYPGVHKNGTSIYNQQLSPDGGHVLAEGVFTSVEGQGRQQIFMLNLGGRRGNVSQWYSNEFNSYCNDGHPLYIKAAAWSPDMSTIYIGDTGKIPYNWNKKFPLNSLCDAAAAFPNIHTGGLSHEWVNYTGCYSLYSIAADSSTVYIAGHELYGDNLNGCKFAGPGSVPAPGLGGLTPGASGGALILNASHTAGLYSRGRGYGADDMLVTKAGLWIASDNFQGTDTCGGVSGHAGICFLP